MAVASRSDLANLFFQEAYLFSRQYPNVEGVRLRLVGKHFLRAPAFRDLGWYDGEEHTIYLLDRLRFFPAHNQLGVMRHELGHAADPNYAMEGSESRADAFSEAATGSPMFYDARGVQSASEGVAGRPAELG